jgi:hypothetical protein
MPTPKFTSSDWPDLVMGPAQKVFAITPLDPPDGSNQSANAFKARAILCSTGMTLKIRDAAGNDVANVPFQQGYNPIQCQEVWSTGSNLNGGNIIGLL